MICCINRFDFFSNEFKAEASFLLRQMFRGVHFLHSHNICHGDIKAQNFVVDSNRTLKMIDFELAEFCGAERHKRNKGRRRGTERHMPPESYRKEARCSYKCDIWMTGSLNISAVFYVGATW